MQIHNIKVESIHIAECYGVEPDQNLKADIWFSGELADGTTVSFSKDILLNGQDPALKKEIAKFSDFLIKHFFKE